MIFSLSLLIFVALALLASLVGLAAEGRRKKSKGLLPGITLVSTLLLGLMVLSNIHVSQETPNSRWVASQISRQSVGAIVVDERAFHLTHGTYTSSSKALSAEGQSLYHCGYGPTHCSQRIALKLNPRGGIRIAVGTFYPKWIGEGEVIQVRRLEAPRLHLHFGPGPVILPGSKVPRG